MRGDQECVLYSVVFSIVWYGPTLQQQWSVGTSSFFSFFFFADRNFLFKSIVILPGMDVTKWNSTGTVWMIIFLCFMALLNGCSRPEYYLWDSWRVHGVLVLLLSISSFLLVLLFHFILLQFIWQIDQLEPFCSPATASWLTFQFLCLNRTVVSSYFINV